MMRRLTPADLPRAVCVAIIARAGRNEWEDLVLMFQEWPGRTFKPNETSERTLTEFHGPPDRTWVGKPVVLAVVTATNPDTGATIRTVAVGTARQHYELLKIALPQFTREDVTDGGEAQ